MNRPERGWGAVGMGWVAGAFSVGATVSAMLLTVAPRVPRAGAATAAALRHQFTRALGTTPHAYRRTFG